MNAQKAFINVSNKYCRKNALYSFLFIFILIFNYVTCPEIIVNSNYNLDQTNQRCIKSAKKEFFCFWNSQMITSNYNIQGQKFDSNRNKIREEFRINQDDGFIGSLPVPVALSNQNFFVVWNKYKTSKYLISGNFFTVDNYTPSFTVEFPMSESLIENKFIATACPLKFQKAILVVYYYLGITYDLYGTIISEDNNILKNPFKINLNSTPKRMDFGRTQNDCASYSDGRFIIVWHSLSDDSYAVIFNPDYTILKNEFMINTSTSNSQIYPNVKITRDNNTIIFYMSNHLNINQFLIYAKVYDHNLNLLKDEYLVSGNDSNSNNTTPRISIEIEYEFLICWVKRITLNLNGDDVFCRYINNNGGFLTPEFRANGVTLNDQNYPDVVSLDNNINIVSWTATGNQDGSGSGIALDLFYFYQIANSTLKLNQEKSQIIALKNSGFFISWICDSCDGNSLGVILQVFNRHGEKIGNEIIVNKYTIGDQTNSRMTVLSNSNILVVWQGQSYSSTEKNNIYGKILSDSGFLIIDEFVIDSSSAYTGEDPDVASNDVKNIFFVVWKSNYILNESVFEGIYGKIYSNDGTVLNSEFLINSSIDNTKQKPKICSIDSNVFIILWEAIIQEDNNLDIVGRLVNSKGQFLSDEFIINRTLPEIQDNVSCASILNKKFVVSYHSQTDIYAKIYSILDTSQVSVFKEEFVVNTFLTGDQNNPSITGLNDGRFIIAWQSYNQDGSENGIFYQVFENYGNKVDSEGQANVFTYGDQIQPSIAQLLYGEVVISFSSVGDSDMKGVYYEYIVNCPEKRFADNDSYNRCSLCSPQCEVCSSKEDNCTCSSGSYIVYDEILKAKKCVKDDTSKYYFDAVLTAFIKCDKSCSTCMTSKNNCLTCNKAADYYPLTDNVNKCAIKSNSPSGYYFDISTNMHEKCDIACSTCLNQKNYCLSCNKNQNYIPLEDKPNNCLSILQIASGYFIDVDLKTFKKCAKQCKNCEKNESNCLQCNNADGFYFRENLASNSCYDVKTILPNEYLDKITNPTDIKIRKCDSKCRNCFDTSENCLSCNNDAGFYPIYDQTDNSKFRKNIT